MSHIEDRLHVMYVCTLYNVLCGWYILGFMDLMSRNVATVL